MKYLQWTLTYISRLVTVPWLMLLRTRSHTVGLVTLLQMALLSIFGKILNLNEVTDLLIVGCYLASLTDNCISKSSTYINN